jgi:hypothetical protein
MHPPHSNAHVNVNPFTDGFMFVLLPDSILPLKKQGVNHVVTGEDLG